MVAFVGIDWVSFVSLVKLLGAILLVGNIVGEECESPRIWFNIFING